MGKLAGKEVRLESNKYVGRADLKEFQQEQKKADKKRSNVNLPDLGIKKGAILYFVGDKTITCKVVDDNKVNYKGKIISLSAAAIKVRKEKGKASYRVSGTVHWKYKGEKGEKGETIDARRRRLGK
ncbi:MAG: hypothetical protein ACR2P5_01520 [Gammaproteobacteria bacterium]